MAKENGHENHFKSPKRKTFRFSPSSRLTPHPIPFMWQELKSLRLADPKVNTHSMQISVAPDCLADVAVCRRRQEEEGKRGRVAWENQFHIKIQANFMRTFCSSKSYCQYVWLTVLQSCKCMQSRCVCVCVPYV